MDVRLPDGTVLSNVPEGTTKAQLVEKLKSSGYDTFKMGLEPKQIGAEGISQAVKDVAGDFHPASQAVVGFKGSLDNAAMRLKQLVGGTLTPQQEMEVKANRALTEASGPASAGNVAGDITMTAPIAGPLYGASRAAAGRVLPEVLAKSVGAGVVGAAIPALTRPTLEGESTLEEAKNGAIGGVLADAALRGGARVIQPITQSEPVKKLLEKKVTPTIGQAAGGVVGNLEEKATSWPLIGNIIQSSRDRARAEFNKAAINQNLPKGMNVSEIGSEGVNAARTKLGDAYERIYEGATVSKDAKLVQDLRAAVNAPAVPLSKSARKTYDSIIENNVLDRLPNGTSLPANEAKKQIEAGLGKAIRDHKFSSNPQDKAIAEALVEARDSFRDLMRRNIGEKASGLPALDKAYASLQDARKASEKAVAQGGVFTPNQLQRASRDGSDARELANAAQAVMGSRVPNSGTADRGLLAALAMNPSMIPLVLGGAVPAGLLYSRPVSNYMMGNLVPGQAALAQGLGALSPQAATAGGILYQR